MLSRAQRTSVGRPDTYKLTSLPDQRRRIQQLALWWESSDVSQQLCAYLGKKYALSPLETYASEHKFTEEEYKAAVTRLCTGRS